VWIRSRPWGLDAAAGAERALLIPREL
jgi:hypothetical protein